MMPVFCNMLGSLGENIVDAITDIAFPVVFMLSRFLRHVSLATRTPYVSRRVRILNKLFLHVHPGAFLYEFFTSVGDVYSILATKGKPFLPARIHLSPFLRP